MTDGRLFARVDTADGRDGLLINDEIVVAGFSLAWFEVSEDGTRNLAVFSGPGEEAVFLDGRPNRVVREVHALGFVGEGPAALPWIVGEDRNDRMCLWTGTAEEGLCCDGFLGWSAAPAAPLLLCAGGDRAALISRAAEPEEVDAIPTELISRGPDGRVIWYVTLGHGLWRLHGADGRVEALPGIPTALLRGPAVGDRPGLLLRTEKGRGWYTGSGRDRLDAEVAETPHEVAGIGRVYAARADGRVYWVYPGGATRPADAHGSAPHPVPGGFAWWELRGDRWRWVEHR